MDQDSIILDIPELDEVPTIELDGLTSSNSIENESIDSASEEIDNATISKIHEYLDKDLEDQDLLIEKLKAFEKKLDAYMNIYKTHRT